MDETRLDCRIGGEAVDFDEKVADWNNLLDAEARRTNITEMTDEKWVENFTTTKHQMLKSIDERIERLRGKLGLAPRGF
jgi:hypothetical protein